MGTQSNTHRESFVIEHIVIACAQHASGPLSQGLIAAKVLGLLRAMDRTSAQEKSTMYPATTC